MDAFWTTVATVIPVLALAVVLEIRAFGARWYEQPRWSRTLQAAAWIAFFVGAALTMSGSLTALRHDPTHPTPAWLAGWATAVVNYGVALLVLAPAIELVVRVLIPLVAATGSLHPRLAFTIWMMYLRARASNRNYVRRQSQALQTITRATALIAEQEALLAENRRDVEDARSDVSTLRADDPRRAEVTEYLEQAKRWQALEIDYIEEGRRLLQMVPKDASGEYETRVANARRLKDKLASLSARERQAVELLLQSLPWGLNPLVPPPPPKIDSPMHPRRRAASRLGSSAARRPRRLAASRRRARIARS